MNYPRLELIFRKKNECPTLHEARYRRSDSDHAVELFNHCGHRMRNALSILMLLSKYRGPKFYQIREENGRKSYRNFEFPNPEKDLTWIQTIGNTFNVKERQNTFGLDLCKNEFLSGTRGNTKPGSIGPAFAVYHPELLRLENLMIYADSDSHDNLMSDEEVKQWAIDIEAFYAKRYGWKRIVQDEVDRIDLYRAEGEEEKKKKNNEVESPSQPIGVESNYKLSPAWEELIPDVKAASKANPKGGNWYVVCMNASWISEMRRIFHDAVVLTGANVHIAYHSPEADDRSDTLEAQWKMHYPRSKTDGADRAKLHEDELLELAEDAVSEASKGGFHLYRSRICHPFLSVLYVPPIKAIVKAAPLGCWCLLEPYPLYPQTFGGRIGLFFKSPDRCLDIYYRSILDFFSKGIRHGHLSEHLVFSGSTISRAERTR